MSTFNKNIKQLQLLKSTVPKKNIESFDKIFTLYESKYFTNFVTAKNLVLKLSSRGQGQVKAVEEINKLFNDVNQELKKQRQEEAKAKRRQAEEKRLLEVERQAEEARKKAEEARRRIKPEAVSTIKISKTENKDFVYLTHGIELKKMFKKSQNSLYMQTVNYYDANGVEIQKLEAWKPVFTDDGVEQYERLVYEFQSWKWRGTKEQLTKEAISAIEMANTQNGGEYRWKPKLISDISTGYSIIKTYAFKNVSSEQIDNAFPTEEQTYADNKDGSCVYDGLLKYFESKPKDKNAKANYNKLIKNESTYKKAYKESELIELGILVQSSITIKDLVNGKDKTFNENQFNKFSIEFINSRYNHLELYLNTHEEPTYVSSEEYNNIKESSEFYVERYGLLSTIDNNYKVTDTNFKKLFKQWKLSNNFSCLSINANDDTYNLLQHYDFGMHRFFNKFEMTDELYHEKDLKKAYYNYTNININKHYLGVPSGAFINCSCDNWTIEDFNIKTSNKLIGFYEVKIISSLIDDKLGFVIGSHHVLSTSMINMLKQYLEFKFINASYAPSVDIPFTEQFLEKEEGIKHYCKAFGQMLLSSTTCNTDIKIKNEDEKYYGIIKKENCKYYANKNIIHMSEPIVNPKSYIHIAYTIHAYTQTLVLEEILKHDIDDIFGVKLDSIVFKKDVELITNDIWDVKEGKIEGLLNKSLVVKNTDLMKSYNEFLQDKENEEIIIVDDDEDDYEYKGEKITRTISNIDNGMYDDDDDEPYIEPPKVKQTNIYNSITTYKIASKTNLKFKKIFTQNNTQINQRVVFIGGKGGSGKTHSLLNYFDQNKLCYTTMCWNLIQGKKQDYKNIIGLSINKLTGLTNGKQTEKTTNKNMRIIVIDEATLLNESDILRIIDEYYYAYIFILGDIEQTGFYYQCSNQNKVINPSTLQCQFIEYTKSYRFDTELNNKLDELRKAMKIYKNEDYSELRLQQYIKREFKQCFHNKDTITYNNDDVGISATDDYKKGNVLSSYFTTKGTTPKYFVKTTDIYNGLLRGQELSETPTPTNYEEKLFKTIHSFQGLDLTRENKIIISVDKCFDYNLYYTAISRARRLDQVVFI